MRLVPWDMVLLETRVVKSQISGVAVHVTRISVKGIFFAIAVYNTYLWPK